MPFFPIDWGRIESGLGASAQAPDPPLAQFRRLTRPSRLLLRLLGPSAARPHPSARRRFSVLRRGLGRARAGLFWLLLLATTGIVLTDAAHRGDGFLAVSRRLLSPLALAAAAAVDLRKGFARLHSAWEDATCSSGFFRYAKHIRRAYSAFAALWALLVVLVLASLWTDFGLRSATGNETSVVRPAALAGESLGLLALGSLSATLFAYGLVILAEFRSLNSDILSEDNIYQVSVLKHYLSIHYKLRLLLREYSNQMQWCCSVSVILGVLGISCWILNDVFGTTKKDWIELCVDSSTVLLHFFNLAGISALSIFVNWSATAVIENIELAAMNSVGIDGEYYSTVSCYCTLLRANSPSVSCGKCIPITFRTTMKALASYSVIIGWLILRQRSM